MSKLIRTCLLGLLTLPMAAQDGNFSVSAHVLNAMESLHKVTHERIGYVMGVDYNGTLEASELPIRVGLSYGLMPGSFKNDIKTSLTLAQLHTDFFMNGPADHLRVVAGLSVNKYWMHRIGHESAEPLAVDSHYPIRDVSGLKLGYRLGLDYQVSKTWEVELMFQQTELAGKNFNSDDHLARVGGVNPGWLQLGITYHF